jgi:copper chaperone CopZ
MHRPLALLCLPLSALALTGCANTTSTSNFKGTEREVAQTIANFQSASTAGEQKKICTEDLAAPVVARLGGTKRCEAAIKSQLSEVDSLEALVESVTIAPGGKTATVQVKSVHEGKKTTSPVLLVDEGGKWKISAFG